MRYAKRVTRISVVARGDACDVINVCVLPTLRFTLHIVAVCKSRHFHVVYSAKIYLKSHAKFQDFCQRG